uniref:Taste receptor type 2 n=1 Tax=Falco tinnunculus TaxID=100819 RepID=A0A8C4TX89_FALTI
MNSSFHTVTQLGRMEACYSQDKLNVTSHDAMVLVLITLQAFAGIWINAFIVFVLCISWAKKKIFSSNEKIVMFLGCSRFWHLCVTWLYFFLSIIYPWSFHVHPIPELLSALQSFLHSSNMWVSAWLCVFYCIKIANFRHIFFIYLKAKIDRIVPWLLWGAVLLSLFLCILIYNITYMAPCKNLNNSTILANTWKLKVKMDEHYFPVFIVGGFGIVSAFMVVTFSAFLLLFSLWKHQRKMQTNSVKNLSMDAHIKAMKYVTSFFFLYSINFICFVLIMIYTTREQGPVTFVILVFHCALPAVHSLVLIFSNPKLEKALLRTLPCGVGSPLPMPE